MIWYLFIICFLRILFFDLDLKLPAINTRLHLFCLNAIATRELPQIYNGLVCGSRDIGQQTEALFISTGLYHLIVVSGGHLLFIDKILNKLPPRFFILNGLILFLFSWMCLFNAPILRALVGYCLIYVSKKLFLFLRQDQLALASGLVSLIIFPEWITSVSLQLSWMAALCMSLRVPKTQKAFLCLLYITPLLGLQNPLWALNNIFFIALFDVFLFPLTVLTVIIPGSGALAHAVWEGVLFILKHIPSSQPENKIFEVLALVRNWGFIFIAQLMHYWIRK